MSVLYYNTYFFFTDIITYFKSSGASKETHQLKVSVTKPDDLNSVLETHMVEVENWVP